MKPTFIFNGLDLNVSHHKDGIKLMLKSWSQRDHPCSILRPQTRPDLEEEDGEPEEDQEHRQHLPQAARLVLHDGGGGKRGEHRRDEGAFLGGHFYS